MAITYYNKDQDLTIKLPEEGEIFRGSDGTGVYKRVGTGVVQLNNRYLGGDAGSINPDSISTRYNIADFDRYFRKTGIGWSGFQESNDINLFRSTAPVTATNETFTQTVRADNPNSGVITSNQKGVVQPGVSIAEANSAPGTTMSVADTSPNRIINNVTGQTAAQMSPTPTSQSIEDGIKNLGATDPTLLAFNEKMANTPPPAQNILTTDSFTGTNPIKIAPQTGNTTGADSTYAGAGATQKSIQDYITMLTPPPSETSTRVKDLIASINTQMESLNGRGAAQLSEEEKQGVNAKKQLLQNAQTELAQRLAEYKAIQAKYQTLNADVEGKPITMSSIIGSQGQVNRAMQAELNTKASEIAMIQANVAGAQGNLNLAQDAADRAVDLKYNDAKDAIDIRLKQLELLQGELDKEEERRSDAIKLYLQDQKDKLAVQIANEKDQNATILNIMNKYIDAGWTSIPKTVAEATALAAKNSQIYKKETTSSSSVGETIKSGNLVYTGQMALEDTQALEGSRGTDGWVDPSIYLQLYQAWVENGGFLKDFLSQYPPKDYVNPANTWLPSFLKNTTTKDDEFDFDSL